jgi:hypothetical protein
MPDDLYAPVARFGFAMSARARFARTSKRFLLRDSAADRAVAAISLMRPDFEEAVERSIGAAGWTVDKRGPTADLADFEFDLRHGVIADFMERSITRPDEGTELLMRYCVTVCSQPIGAAGTPGQADDSIVIWLDKPPGRSMPQHSKIWIRFSCLRYRSKRLDKMSLEEMRAFHDEASLLAVKIKSATVGPYRRVLSEIVKDEPRFKEAKLSLKSVFYIDSFTVSVLDKTFPNSYRQLVLGEDLSDVTEKSPMLGSLDRLKGAFETPASELLPVDDLGFARGVYWIDLDNARASLVGIANNSLDQSSTRQRLSELGALKSAPSNVIGILSGSMLASAI